MDHIDSGASDHMCNFLLHLHNIRNIKGHTQEITILDESKVKVSQLDKVQITALLMLKYVLFVPQFRINLISIPKFCRDNNVHVIFTNEHCMVHDHLMTKNLPLGKFTGGSYTLGNIPSEAPKETNDNNTISDNVITPKSKLEKAKLWHIKIGMSLFLN